MAFLPARTMRRGLFRQPRGTRGRRRSTRREQPRFGSLQLLDVVVMVGEKRAGGLDVSHARELELEADALLVALPAQLVHFGAQFLGALGGLGRLRDLALELCDPRVALGERRFVVLVGPGDRVAAVARRARALEPRRHRRLRRLVALRLRLTRDLRLRGRAIVPVTHRKARLSPRAGKEIARTHQMGTGYEVVTSLYDGQMGTPIRVDMPSRRGN